MLEMLLNSNPNLYNQCIDILKRAVRETEVRTNSARDTFGFRPFRPDDFFTIANSWEGTFPSNIKCNVTNDKSTTTVPTNNCWVYFGWFTDTDLGINSNFSVVSEGVLKSIVSSTFVYNCENPAHMFIDIQNIKAYRENTRLEFKVENKNPYDVMANIIPILYRITSKPALNMLNTYEAIKISDKVQMPKQSHLKSLRESLTDMLSIQELKGIIHEFRNPTATEFVKIKNGNNIEHDEMRAKLDPNYRLWLQDLKNSKVCDFCGSTIERTYTSQYCHYCGVNLKTKIKREA